MGKYTLRVVSQEVMGKYTLKKRKFLGPTSMDAELSLIMANMAKVFSSYRTAVWSLSKDQQELRVIADAPPRRHLHTITHSLFSVGALTHLAYRLYASHS